MRNRNSKLESILNEPSYWIENVNGILYNSILNFMEENHMNRSQLASHLELSKGRISQILNDGEINFSMKKVIEIAVKIGTYPKFDLIPKDLYLQKNISFQTSIPVNSNFLTISSTDKTLKISKDIKFHFKLSLNYETSRTH